MGTPSPIAEASVPAPGALVVGSKVGNYVVTRLLGQGGMGAVYLAEHPDIGRRVAIKVLAPHLADTPAAAKRFVAEARAVTRIDHPNIIYIFDFGRTEDGRLYYAMEALQGQELKAVLLARGKLTPHEVWPYLEQICGALSAAHGQGVIHRDLKPDNIFVVDGPRLTLKILDFGIAKLLETQAGTHTSTGLLMGTPQYMSPEQASGRPDLIGPRSDIYSLGIIVYQMLTGRVPFCADTPIVTAAMHVERPPQPLIELEPQLSLAVNALVMQCLAKTPGDRPSDAAELAARFAEAAEASLSVRLPGLAAAIAPADSLAFGSTLAKAAVVEPSVVEPSVVRPSVVRSSVVRPSVVTGPLAPSPADVTGPLAPTIIGCESTPAVAVAAAAPPVGMESNGARRPIAPPKMPMPARGVRVFALVVVALVVGVLGAGAWGLHAWSGAASTRAPATPDARAQHVARFRLRPPRPDASRLATPLLRRERDAGVDGSPHAQNRTPRNATPRARPHATRRGKAPHPLRVPAPQRVRKARDWGEVQGGL